MAKLTKLSDDFFSGNHPNGILEGHTETVKFKPELPEIGQRYYFHEGISDFSTSIVTELLSSDDDGFTFKTLYSTYKIEY